MSETAILAQPSDVASLSIRIERIMTTEKVGAAHAALLTPVVTVVGFVFLLLMTGSKPGLALLLGVLFGGPLGLIGIPVMYMMLGASKSRAIVGKIKSEATAALSNFIGKEPEYIDTDLGLVSRGIVSGSGIAYSDGRLYILDAGLAAEIPWSCVRNWRWKIAGRAGGFAMGRSAVEVNMELAKQSADAAMRQHLESGFTIAVSNIDKPEWRFMTTNEVVLKRWEEILTQMNEGRLPAH